MRTTKNHGLWSAGAALVLATTTFQGSLAESRQLDQWPRRSRTVRVNAQPRPGAAAREIDIKVHPVPTDIASAAAHEVRLADNELVLGVVVKGDVIAYPIRYLAMYEVVDDTVGGLPIAPTW